MVWYRFPNAISLADADSKCFREHEDSWSDKIVDAFHQAGFVHGDLRPPDFIVDSDKDRLLLIVFDWGGKEGEHPSPKRQVDHDKA